MNNKTLYTRCPACSTAFKVTDKLLSAANGKVRCGACLAIFQATDYMLSPSASLSSSSPSEQQPPKESTATEVTATEYVADQTESVQISQQEEELAGEGTAETEDLLSDNSSIDELAIEEASTAEDLSTEETSNWDEGIEESTVLEDSQVTTERFEVEVSGVGENNDYSNQSDLLDDPSSEIKDLSASDDLGYSKPPEDLLAGGELETDEQEEILDDPSSFKDSETVEELAAIDDPETDKGSQDFESEQLAEEDLPSSSLDTSTEPETYIAHEILAETQQLEEEQEGGASDISDNINEEIDQIEDPDLEENSLSREIAKDLEESDYTQDPEIPDIQDENLEEELSDFDYQNQSFDFDDSPQEIDEDELSYEQPSEDDVVPFDSIDADESFDSEEMNTEDLSEEDFEDLSDQLSEQMEETDASPDPLDEFDQVVEENKTGIKTKIFIAAAVILLLIGLQQVWSNRQALAWSDTWGGAIKGACQYLPCDLKAKRDISKIRLLQRQLSPDEENETMLDIKVLIINEADFEQPYPTIKIKFTNPNGEHVDTKIFLPQDYLDADPESTLMPIGSEVHIGFNTELSRPDALGFEFIFE